MVKPPSASKMAAPYMRNYEEQRPKKATNAVRKNHSASRATIHEGLSG